MGARLIRLTGPIILLSLDFDFFDKCHPRLDMCTVILDLYRIIASDEAAELLRGDDKKCLFQGRVLPYMVSLFWKNIFC